MCEGQVCCGFEMITIRVFGLLLGLLLGLGLRIVLVLMFGLGVGLLFNVKVGWG